MKALVYRGPGEKEWIEVDKPLLQKPTDVIVKITKTTICGTDLHILKGDVPAVTDGRILGHEGVGIVDEVGDAVTQFKKGDKVIISAITSCGSCYYCKKQLQAHCEDGGWILGHLIDGTQAEYVRIPHADNSLHRVPDAANDEALVMLSDILPTSFEVGTLSSNVNPGDTVAIVGAGPIGLAAVLTAQFYSPAEIIMIDLDDNRLQASLDLGATATINSTKENVLEKIKSLTEGRGVDVAMEAVGIPATFELCQDIISPGGRIANIGVHGTKVDLHLEELWIKNISITTGLVSAYSTPLLLKTVESGKVQPEKLITHRFKLDDMLEAYEVFSNAAQEGTLKVIISNE
ncbi:zinc-dependent alcohol dehydrogenase family protein [Staphylococcus lutrae]|uniref:Alcohol dehydrogenase n=1 Tax=Staphylococcus lutrae TaxID=155085 RepID=A0AAC9RU25_9STAP|nr:zinc-dependent alcohol dehydrogenase family protein [Staphylococcus lutrae]ARJ50802.1 alcohol dehydrogenase [Staphylococcus lutrae]PNZ39761.1 alcohol dehydrogenase [Staphylococcus lutrae]